MIKLSNFWAAKKVKMVLFEALRLANLISRKIWMAEKCSNFHRVLLSTSHDAPLGEDQTGEGLNWFRFTYGKITSKCHFENGNVLYYFPLLWQIACQRQESIDDGRLFMILVIVIHWPLLPHHWIWQLVCLKIPDHLQLPDLSSAFEILVKKSKFGKSYILRNAS